MQTLLMILGRMCFSLIFILAAVQKMMDWQGAEQSLVNAMCDFLNYFQGNMSIQNWVESLVSWAPQLLLCALIFELVGGVLVFFGVKVRLGAFLLFLFLIPTTIVFHHFWLLQGDERELQSIMFLKNLSIFGGTLFLMACGKGIKKEKTASTA